MRVLALSDVHVGSGLGYGRTPADRMGDFERVLSDAADLAALHDVDAVLFGGDMFHGPAVPSSQYLAVKRAFCTSLAQAGIPVVAVSGNGAHDSAGNQGEDNALAVLHDPGRFDVYTRAALHRLPGLVVACVPWASTARLRAMLNGGQVDDTNAAAAELVVRICADLRTRAEAEHPGVPCVLLGHWAVDTGYAPNGIPVTEFREVVLEHAALERLGFDAMVWGHVHKAQHLNGEDAATPSFYTGSPLCLSFGEESAPHGCWLLEFAPPMRREAPDTTFIPIESRPFVTLNFDASEVDVVMGADVGFLGIADDAIVRLRYTATPEQARAIDHAAIEAALLTAGAHKVWQIEANVVRESRARVAGVTAELSPLDAVDLWAEAQGLDASLAKAVRGWTGEALEAVA